MFNMTRDLLAAVINSSEYQSPPWLGSTALVDNPATRWTVSVTRAAHDVTSPLSTQNGTLLSHSANTGEQFISSSLHNNTNYSRGAREHVTKVILLTYSRSGSSFLGELINRNKQGSYHFEPLGGVYSALYGLGKKETSTSVFRYQNQSDR